MSKRLRLCRKSEVADGQMLAIDVAGLPPVAAFNVKGEIFVIDNVCTHNTAILTDGFFDGETIECPLHGGCFNVKTGEAMRFPCEKPVRTYSVEVESDELFINIQEQ